MLLLMFVWSGGFWSWSLDSSQIMILVVLSWDSQQQKIMNSLIMCCLNECLLVLVLVVLVLVLCCVGVGGSC